MTQLFNSVAEAEAHNARVQKDARERRSGGDLAANAKRAKECAIADGYGPHSIESMTTLEPKPKGRTSKTTAERSPQYLIGLCRAAGLPEPVAEYEFSATRRWRFDYAFPKQKIAVEIEGGIWKRGGGAHSHPSNIMRDIEKYNAAALSGWRILRYMPEDVMNSLGDLKQCLQ